MATNNPWDRYWNSANRQSCFFSSETSDEQQLIDLWQGFSTQLKDKTKILDLACGTGYLSSLLNQQNSSFEIIGVDKGILPEGEKNAGFKLKGEVELERLPFAKSHFDAATSLFGLEYSNLSKSLVELARVLRSESPFCFVMHHSDSELIGVSRAKYNEMLSLRRRGGFLDMFGKFLLGQVSSSDVQLSGENYLDQIDHRSLQIRDEVIRSIAKIMHLANKDQIQAQVLGNEFFLGFDAHHQRLSQMLKAAKTEEGMQQFKSLCNEAGLKTEDIKTFSVNSDDEQSVLLAWQVNGQRI